MFSRFMPREGQFFTLFNAHADEIVTGTQALVTLMQAVGKDASRVDKATTDIDEAERCTATWWIFSDSLCMKGR